MEVKASDFIEMLTMPYIYTMKIQIEQEVLSPDDAVLNFRDNFQHFWKHMGRIYFREEDKTDIQTLYNDLAIKLQDNTEREKLINKINDGI